MGSGKRCALPESRGEEYAFFNGRSKIEREVEEFRFIASGGDERPWAMTIFVLNTVLQDFLVFLQRKLHGR